MAKKKTKKHKKFAFRNATPSAPRAPRAPRSATPGDDTPLKRLGYTAAGAAGTSLAGSFLSHEGWAPKTIATALAAVGAGLAWKGDGPGIRSLGAGVMSAAGSQLALMLIDDRDRKAPAPTPSPRTKKQSNSDELPAGALENAFERAKVRLAMASGEQMD